MASLRARPTSTWPVATGPGGRQRSEFYRALPLTAFYGFNRPGVESSEAIIANWWRRA